MGLLPIHVGDHSLCVISQDLFESFLKPIDSNRALQVVQEAWQ